MAIPTITLHPRLSKYQAVAVSNSTTFALGIEDVTTGLVAFLMQFSFSQRAV